MFYQIFLLELKKNLKSPAFSIFFLLVFIITFLFTVNTNTSIQFAGISHGKEWHNAPIIMAQMLNIMSVLGILFTMVLIGRSVVKDFENNIHELIFTRPIGKTQYLGGRFFGSFIANTLMFLGIILGFEIGILFIEDVRSGPYQFGSYLLPLSSFVIPNLLLIGSALFALSTLSRKMTSTYIASIAFLVVYTSLTVIFYRVDNVTLKVLVDPFGITALRSYTQYWTVSDMNTSLIPINPIFLFNRIIWLSVSFAILMFTYHKFKLTAFLESKKKEFKVVSDNTQLVDYKMKAPTFSFNKNKLFSFSQCLTISWREFKKIVFHPAFIILTVIAMFQISINFMGSLGNQSGSIYPFTSWFIEQTIHLWIYMLPITIFFGGMLVWKEKDHRTDEIINTLPIPNWFSYANKLMTLSGIYILYLSLTIIVGVSTQYFVLDFADVELGLFIKRLFGIDFFIFLHMAIVVLFIQNLSPNKFVGFFFSALFFVIDLVVFDVLRFDNILFRYGRVPNFIYSNMNGFGHYAQSILWYTIYWAFFGAIIAWLTILLWRRGNENSVFVRFKYVRKSITKNQIIGILILFIMFATTASFIGYNKYVLNPYISENAHREMAANYEKKFSQYSNAIRPTILDINLKVELLPEERTAHIEGVYTLHNHNNQPINEIYVNLNDWNLSNLKAINLDRSFIKKSHSKEFGFRILELQQALKPGDTINMSFEYDIIAHGFTENLPKNDIVENGTCLMLTSYASDYFPILGYNVNNELVGGKRRSKFGLPKKADSPKLANAKSTKAILDISRVNYEAVISTSLDQTVISVGGLVAKWEENNRNYFHFKTNTNVVNEIVILSGRYEVAKEIYKGINVEVYYHPKHNFNTQSIMDGLKDSYDYGNEYFGQYPYNDLRVVEVPAYLTDGVARHFPTTFIWTESEGFITRYDEGDIDIVYGIAAHENAHHYWANFVTPAFAEGAFMLTETVCQYVMAMLIEHKFGKDIGRDYVKRDMNSYLRGRSRDNGGENSLIESSDRQSYLGYKKSTSIMYALQDYIGEDKVGEALGKIVEKYGFRIDTFALASDLIDEFYKVCPDSMKYLVTDLFTKITLYENKINTASYVLKEDGKYLINLEVETFKFYADSIGNQIEAPINDYIYVALLDEEGEAFYYEKHKFTQNITNIQLITEQLPGKAGIDPYLLLIDRKMDDNIRELKKEDDSMYSSLKKLTAHVVK